MMRSLLSWFVVCAGLVACYTGAEVDWNGEPVAPEDSQESDAAAKKSGDLPCDVATLLSQECTRCHGTKPSHGALNSLVSYGDLVETHVHELTAAEVSVSRMKNAKRPMPPSGLLSAERVAVLQKWIDKGYPSKKCVSVADSGLPDATSN